MVPPLYNGAAGVTALKLPLINPTTGHYEMRIADGSDNPGGTLQESGRIYTCDEFPPASWVEGGVGTPGQNNPEGDGKSPAMCRNSQLTWFCHRWPGYDILRANVKNVCLNVFLSDKIASLICIQLRCQPSR